MHAYFFYYFGAYLAVSRCVIQGLTLHTCMFSCEYLKYNVMNAATQIIEHNICCMHFLLWVTIYICVKHKRCSTCTHALAVCIASHYLHSRLWFAVSRRLEYRCFVFNKNSNISYVFRLMKLCISCVRSLFFIWKNASKIIQI